MTYLSKLCLHWAWWILSYFNNWSVFFFQVESFQINQRMKFSDNVFKATFKTIMLICLVLCFVWEWKAHFNFKKFLLLISISSAIIHCLLEWETQYQCLYKVTFLIFWFFVVNFYPTKQSIFRDNDIQWSFTYTQYFCCYNHIFFQSFSCFSKKWIEKLLIVKLIFLCTGHFETTHYLLFD